jgi:hypothetical protein
MKNHNLKHPYYYIYPTINCGGIIYVNDVPVISNIGEKSKSGLISGQIPINHVLLQTGKNNVIGKMIPRFNKSFVTEEESLIIDFEMFDSGLNWKETDHTISPSIESPWNGLSKKINYPVFEITTEIEVELPFVLNGWQNSVNLKDVKEIKTQVFNYYKKVHSILKEHNAQKFIELSKEKEELQTKAFYFDETKKQEIRKSIIALFSENLEVLPLNESELKLEFWGYGKLATLLRFDGSPALQFISPNAEKESNVELEVKLHLREKNGELCII